MAAKKPADKKAKSGKRLFKPNQHIVYPAHGVGIVTSIDQEVIAGFDIEVYTVHFEQDKMTLRVPTAKAGTERFFHNAQRPRPHQTHNVVTTRARI